MRILFLVLAIVLTSISAARAEVASASAGGFVIRSEVDVSAPAERVWSLLQRVGQWWSSEHTYSGEARRMSLEPRAGGCWCERWDGQSVEHGRVVLVMEHEGVRTLRLEGALGPLQEMGVQAILTYTIAPHDGGAKITMTYRVSGDPGLGLDQVAPLVDGVLTEQLARLRRHAATGRPE